MKNSLLLKATGLSILILSVLVISISSDAKTREEIRKEQALEASVKKDYIGDKASTVQLLNYNRELVQLMKENNELLRKLVNKR